MTLASDLSKLTRDLTAEGVPYDASDLSFPLLVRIRIALTTSLGHAVIMAEEWQAGMCAREQYQRRVRLGVLRRRVLDMLRAVDVVGARSRWADWFKRWS